MTNFYQFISDSFDGSTALVNTSVKNGIEYIEKPMAFDIETSSFKYNDKKLSCMYIWQFAIGDNVVYGRTWEEFFDFMDVLRIRLELNKTRRIIVFVHNLKYEFQFLKRRFLFDEVFGIDSRTPAKAISYNYGVEFRCSYLLSGYSLENLSKNLKNKKKVGDLDYNLIRTPKTPLTEKELGYCLYDVLVITEYIQDKLNKGEKISDILLTKTMYVRRDVKNYCFYGDGLHKNNNKEYKEYKNFIKSLTLDEQEYIMVSEMFSGGFTHTNPVNAEKHFKEKVVSMDFSSSYPSVLVTEKFISSKGKKLDIELKRIPTRFNYFYIFEVELEDLELKNKPDIPLSLSKFNKIKEYELYNGRVWRAEKCSFYSNSIDWEYIKEYYDFKIVKVKNIYEYTQAYLPKRLVEKILFYYNNKTKLKNVVGEESNYNNNKELLNSIYGMMVTAIIHSNFGWSEKDDWYEEYGDLNDELETYNNSQNRFLSYIWGVQCTSYARRNLLLTMSELKNPDDYIYSDTDSMKILNYDLNKYIFNNYNKKQDEKIKKISDFYNMDIELWYPKTIKNVSKPIGYWDFDGEYKEFKALRAKAYMYRENDNSLHITLAGVNKKDGVKFFNKKETEGKDPFEIFDNSLVIPKEYSGKNTLYYFDEEYSLEIEDYLGNKCVVSEMSGVYMETSDFSLDIEKNILESMLFIDEKCL